MDRERTDPKPGAICAAYADHLRAAQDDGKYNTAINEVRQEKYVDGHMIKIRSA